MVQHLPHNREIEGSNRVRRWAFSPLLFSFYLLSNVYLNKSLVDVNRYVLSLLKMDEKLWSLRQKKLNSYIISKNGSTKHDNWHSSFIWWFFTGKRFSLWPEVKTCKGSLALSNFGMVWSRVMSVYVWLEIFRLRFFYMHYRLKNLSHPRIVTSKT